ncbi:gluconate 2-dehydrogenase subunit 3 family protein [Variovorax sp. Sphag1AA]|uniref:gluconate 2-dehydrogenase subunit 3 family protein n=1 Tax=Variovorax sp. Sphag1AA TaxID=2587027 RepID=UPI0016161CFF|nr:gluconate 2-dehydrogenase subunit 3 family protein [Variovorax sp. Sphag1AA]MBB3182015.1 gluconate 2-dehydrogenase gamma chain [Variovorax sp. Sphag1AA]
MAEPLLHSSRRIFLKSLGASTAATAASGFGAAHAHSAKAPIGSLDVTSQAYTFLLPDEAAFIEAAVDVFLPKDEVGPGGVESGVVYYIDQYLAGAFGVGSGTNLQGPFLPGTATQGYQLPFTPQQIYRIGVREVDAHCKATLGGKSFHALSHDDRNSVLKRMQEGAISLPTVPARTFLLALYNNTMEGYFADPAYGGNRDKATWRMLGFPGVGYVYTEDIRAYSGRRQQLEPQSLADFR